MDATLTLSQKSMEQLLRAAVPFTIDLSSEKDGTRSISIDEIHSFLLVENRGARATGKVRVEWPVLGVSVPLSVDDLTIDILISISGQADTTSMDFQFEIQDADIRNVPGFVEKPVIAKVNEALRSESTTLSWPIGKTLRIDAALPKMIVPAKRLGTSVEGTTLAITKEALVLRTSLTANVA